MDSSMFLCDSLHLYRPERISAVYNSNYKLKERDVLKLSHSIKLQRSTCIVNVPSFLYYKIEHVKWSLISEMLSFELYGPSWNSLVYKISSPTELSFKIAISCFNMQKSACQMKPNFWNALFWVIWAFLKFIGIQNFFTHTFEHCIRLLIA